MANFRRRTRLFIAKRFQIRYISLILLFMFATAVVTGYTVYYTTWIMFGEKLAAVYPQGLLLDIVNKVFDVPEQYKTDSLEVVYRANHPKLVESGGGINPEAIELELPYSHLEALLYFVASRVHNPMGMANEFHSGNSWAAKYEAECMKLQQQNLEIDEGNDNDRLGRNGWV